MNRIRPIPYTLLSKLAACMALTASLVISSLALAQTAPPQPLIIAGANTYEYSNPVGISLLIHAFQPSATRPEKGAPAIVFFFGGGWTRGNVEQFLPQAKHLAARGMVALLADYRVSNRHDSTPFDSMADAHTALRWVRDNAAELGVDVSRIVASGGSAGGHLAAVTAVIPDYNAPKYSTPGRSKPNALVLFNPAVNISERLSERFVGKPSYASPLANLVAGLPPTIVFHGRADAIVPFSDAQAFCHKAISNNDRCELKAYDDADHGFFNAGNGDGTWFRDTTLQMDSFLTELGYLAAPSPSRVLGQ